MRSILLAVLAVAGLLPGAAKVGKVKGSILLPDGQVIHPAGRGIRLPTRPVDICTDKTGRWLFVKDNAGIEVLDRTSLRVFQGLPFPRGGGSLHGIVVTPDGSTLLATSAGNSLYIAQRKANRYGWTGRVKLPGLLVNGAAMPCGIALSHDSKTAWVCDSIANCVEVINLASRRVVAHVSVGIAPWGIALSPGGKTAYVTDWGGRHPLIGEMTAKSAGTAVPIDRRGIADTGEVSVVNTVTLKVIARVPVGLHPCDIQLDAMRHRLYVANANSDTVSVIDTSTNTLAQTVTVHPLRHMRFGSMPDALVIGPTHHRLFVAAAGNNAVDVLSLRRSGNIGQSLGWLPTGWYPGSMVVAGGQLCVADVKGLGARLKPKEAKGFSVFDYLGTVDCIPLPTELQLQADTARVVSTLGEGRRPLRRHASAIPVPVPASWHSPSVFHHVVYIIRENRTYDQVLGDVRRGNGDSALVMYGEQVTPNAHRLVRQFELLDNYYCNGTISADGHSWLTEGNSTDHLEKAFGGFTRSYTFGDDPITYSSSGFIWDDALAHGLSVVNFGEMVYSTPRPAASFRTLYRDYLNGQRQFKFSQSLGIERLWRHTIQGFPGWNLAIPDQLRAALYIQHLRSYEQRRRMPTLTILYLPQDHTSGTTPGQPTPQAMVADNDLALGRVVQAISRSPFWKDTCIFVTEDDAKDGLDHVDGHRSVAMVISPYTVRGKVVHQFYNQTSILHTMEHMLGLPPMNQMDQRAPLMTACFTSTPNFSPFTSVPARISLDTLNPAVTALKGIRRRLAMLSAQQDWASPDAADEQSLNRILWAAARGYSTPYP